MTRSMSQVAIIGAGPYGLAAAAHLKDAQLDTHVFGDPMAFWDGQMPRGMLLRSPWEGSHISSPGGTLSLDQFGKAFGIDRVSNLPLENFISYGRWFQEQAVPEVDRRMVDRVQRESNGFVLTLADGETFRAGRVVVAGGIAPFRHRPSQFDSLPSHLVSHSSDHRDLQRFGGKRILVVGGGQSALESAALLHEAGADVEVITRAPRIRWLGKGARAVGRLGPLRKPVRRVLYPPSDVGPPGLNWMIATPDLFKRLPVPLQRRIERRGIRPAGAGWLRARTQTIPIRTGFTVVGAYAESDRLHVELSDGSRRDVHHAILATGFRIDVARYPFLAPELVEQVYRVDGYPMLNARFESTVPGLHFLGAPSARSFSPLMRFVAGTEYTASALARGLRSEQAMVDAGSVQWQSLNTA
jgi:FAD-dependent urate hydroxylase